MNRWKTCLILSLLALTGCNPEIHSEIDLSITEKITFDLNQFDQDGLYGPSGGKRSLDYEFCIPHGNHYAEEVREIDPTVDLFLGSSGRIGCTEGQTLAIGNTHQTDFQLVLMELANLDYVERIQQTYWE
jgi:hypothetical protein